jgi:hypothetical protein
MSAPLLTVAVLAGTLRERAQRVVDAVAAQDVADGLELLVVDLFPDREPIEIPAGVQGRRLELAGAPLSRGKAEAVREAAAPFVAFLEDHCYPRPGWAKALIDAHRGPWAAVGYAYENANPDTWITRAGLIVDCVPFVEPERGPTGFVSGNNVSYRRDAVLAFGDRLDELIRADFLLQQALRARGEQLFVEPAAVAAHEHYRRMGHVGGASGAYCRLLAAARARGWGLRRRLFYAVAAPLAAPAIKLVRLARAILRRPHLAAPALSAAPVVLVAYTYAAVGESRGYFDQSADYAEEQFLHWEFGVPRAEGT